MSIINFYYLEQIVSYFLPDNYPELSLKQVHPFFSTCVSVCSIYISVFTDCIVMRFRIALFKLQILRLRWTQLYISLDDTHVHSDSTFSVKWF